MRPRHVISLVIGILLLAPALGLMLGGGAIGVYELAARGDNGWHAVDIDRLESDGVAVTTREALIDFRGPAALVDWVDLDVRFRATPASGEQAFIGVAPTADLAAYLGNATHDEIVTVTWNGETTYRSVAGTTAAVAAPTAQDFWVARATGPGTQELIWTPESGTWSTAFLNASGEPGVAMTVQAAIRSGALLALAIGMVVLGVALAVVGTILVIQAVRNQPPSSGAAFADRQVPPQAWAAPTGGAAVPPSGWAAPTTGALPPPPASAAPPADRGERTPDPARAHPLVMEARIAPNLSRWLWLVKWALAIPHVIVLFFLWCAVVVTTIVAWFAILITARYPRSLFDFNVGVLRWSWRVAHYCGIGGLGTDRYPPFTLDELPDDDTRLDVDYPERLSRGLIFVKWILLLPHWIIVALIAGTQSRTDERGVQVGGWPGVLALLALVAGIVLLASGVLNRGLFDVMVGLNRWTYRVAVYALLMTDVYPPFRYDGGGSEPWVHVPPGPGAPPIEVAPPTTAPPPATGFTAPPPAERLREEQHT
ncbi:DUF4389 domain-containing protein [Intrasporangium sp.]|uniref:DUF4389 domain-containing protein n=1 Tax=Intrasporangium sp. TaxID=1925024 RepID=UPI002939E232|nr:DUF4389 domain-containing protein [Intrasporangium sp.]MDV3220420.1 DUF4389 domain-containing protein [Intrasporangium sp.]